MELKTVRLAIPEGCNIILGQSHFVKTVEDLYEAMVTSIPSPKFGIAFCEASGPRKVRREGTDPDMIQAAEKNAKALSAGHSFIIVMKDCFPINALNAVKMCPEVCRIYCATANPTEVIIAETEQGRGILGVVDGEPPVGIETEDDVKQRKELLRNFGYKR
jgi:adenosine/AMP kinase